MKPENVMQSKGSQTQKDKHCVIPLIRDPQNCEIHRDRKQKGGHQGLGEEDRESVYYGTEF